MIRVLLADDSAAFRRGLRVLLEADGRFQVVAEAGDGYEAVREAERTAPDLVLMDIRMPGQNGLAAARAVRERLPATRVVILTEVDGWRFRAEAAGCSGYLLKSDAPERLMGGVVGGDQRRMTDDSG